MGGAISGITGAVSGIIGGIGTNKALNQQEKAINQQKDATREGYNTASGLLTPYTTGGADALSSAQTLAGQTLDRDALLKSYYGSDEYAQDSDQARRTQLASAAATGGLGTTSTNNALAAIAPTLGQQYLNDMTAQQQQQFQNYYSLANMGLSASNQLAGYATGQAQQLSNLYGTQGQVKAQKAALPYQVTAAANSSIGNGAASDVNQFTGMFGSAIGGMI